MDTPPALLPLATIGSGALWPVVLGALVSVIVCLAAATVVIVQRHASGRRRGPLP
jgi:hypothetical protein